MKSLLNVLDDDPASEQVQKIPVVIRIDLPRKCPLCDWIRGSVECFDSHVKHDKVSGLKMYHCQVCLFKCRIRKSMVGHLTSHTRERRFACLHCSYRGSSKGAVTKHFVTKHKGKCCSAAINLEPTSAIICIKQNNFRPQMY